MRSRWQPSVPPPSLSFGGHAFHWHHLRHERAPPVQLIMIVIKNMMTTVMVMVMVMMMMMTTMMMMNKNKKAPAAVAGQQRELRECGRVRLANAQPQLQAYDL